MKKLVKQHMKNARAAMAVSDKPAVMEIPGAAVPGTKRATPKLTGNFGGKGAFAFKGTK